MSFLTKTLIIVIFTSLMNSAQDSTYLTPIIPDFQVNDNEGISGAIQNGPSVSADSSGNFVITWNDNRNGDSDIYVQRYSSNGTMLGENFRVNDEQSLISSSPSISVDNSGNFTIAWSDSRNGNQDIYAQRCSSDGTILGENFKVNEDSYWCVHPRITSDKTGGFVVTWLGYHDVYGGDVYLQRYSREGLPLGDNLKVNNEDAHPGPSWSIPSISSDYIGNFIITWQSGYDIYFQLFFSDGSAIGTNQKVNESSTNIYEGSPSVSMGRLGNYVITWQNTTCIYAQQYSSDGASIGNNFIVNEVEIISDVQPSLPSVSIDGQRNFVISWWNYNLDEPSQILAQRYSNEGAPLGGNLVVNDYQHRANGTPKISTLSDSQFIIVWEDGRNNNSDIYAQRFANDGSFLENNFKINDDISSVRQREPVIDIDGNGNFVIAWVDYRNGDNNYNFDIYAQRYESNGALLGNNFIVNDKKAKQTDPEIDISSDASGDFVISWVDRPNDQFGIYVQQYSNEGIALGNNFKANNVLNGGRFSPSVSVGESGNFVIAWTEQGNGSFNIYAQHFSSEGTELGSNFRVNEVGGGVYEDNPSVSYGGNGNFVITWEESNSNVYAQRFSNDGTKLGGNFKVNEVVRSTYHPDPSVSADSSGNFVIMWKSGEQISDIYFQRYSSDGTSLGNNIKVNDVDGSTFQEYNRSTSNISVDKNGNFVIIWQDSRNGEYDHDIYAQRYSSDGTALGKNFIVTKMAMKNQFSPDVKLLNNRIYCTWVDNSKSGTGYDIWANVLDFHNPFTEIEFQEEEIPSTFSLFQNYPNPFNPSTVIKYQIPNDKSQINSNFQSSNHVTLKVFDILGREVATLVNQNQKPGNYEVSWDGAKQPSGVYFYQLSAGDFRETKKMILLQ